MLEIPSSSTVTGKEKTPDQQMLTDEQRAVCSRLNRQTLLWIHQHSLFERTTSGSLLFKVIFFLSIHAKNSPRVVSKYSFILEI